jgi:hypothetical protein
MRLTISKSVWIPMVVLILMTPLILNVVADTSVFAQVNAAELQKALESRSVFAKDLGVVAVGLIGGLTTFAFKRYQRGSVPRVQSMIVIASLSFALASAMCGVFLYSTVQWAMEQPLALVHSRIPFHAAGQFWMLVVAAILAGGFVVSELFTGSNVG